MNAIKKDEGLTGYLRESVESIVNTIESVHQTAIDVQMGLLTTVGLPEDKAAAVKDKQFKLIGSVYEAIRATNSQVANMAGVVSQGAKEGVESVRSVSTKTPQAESKKDR